LTRRILLSLILVLCVSFLAFPQEVDEGEIDLYGLGDQTFSINAGVLIPLFFFGFGGEPIEPAAGHLKVGVVGALRWGTFLGNRLSVGAELGGMYASTVLSRTLVAIPVTGMIDYAFRFYPFEFSLHANLGVNFLRLDDDLYFGPIVRPGFSAYWNYNAEWSFGLRTEYWLVPEIYFGSDPPSTHTRVGNMMTVTFSTLYHF
jgi:hypothetical protein